MGERDRGPGLTKAQRDSIIERDGHHSIMRHYDETRGFYQNENCPYDGDPCSSLQVHHITTQRDAYDAGWTPEQVNNPRNLATVSECEHIGKCKDNRIKR